MSLITEHLYEFGNFRLDPAERVLYRDGQPVPLTPKAFQLLTLLVANHGRVVEKDGLINEVWPDSIVEEGNLAVSVAMIRKALVDDASSPRYIETIPRRGYRFVAEVREVQPVPPEGVELKEELPRPVHSPWRRSPVAVWFGVVLLATVGLAWYVVRNAGGAGSAPILSAPFSSTRFSTSGSVSNAVISPDGKFAAFVDTSGGMQGLWLRQLETGEDIEIVPASNDFYFGLAFANSGRSIFFVRMSGEGHPSPAIFRVSALGGIPVKVIDGALNWISLSPSDDRISFVRCSYKPDNNCSLYTANTDGSDERKLLSKPAPMLVESNQFSPDGRSIAVAYGEYMTGISDYRIALVDPTSGTETEILSKRFFDIKSLQWLPSGDELMFTVRDFEDGRVSIWKVPVIGGEPKMISKDASSYQDLSLDKKGEQMIATQVENDFQIYVSSGNEIKPLTSARDLAVSPDGRIVYSTFDGNIWTINPNGSDRRQLTTGSSGDLHPRYSVDGRSIFFRSNRSGDSNIWRMNPDGTGLANISQPTGGVPCGSSRDGKWLYYTKERRLFRVSVSGGDDAPVADTRLLKTVCSPDGTKAAFFLMKDGFKIGVMNTADGKIEEIFDYGTDRSYPQRIAWSPDSKTLNYVTSDGGRNTLWRRSLVETTPHKLADLGGDEIRDLAVMPDGETVVFVRGKWINNAVLIRGLK